MFYEIKNRINKELKKFIKKTIEAYPLKKASPLLFNSIKDFILRDGKRIRPILFSVGYLGFAKSCAPNLYASALSLELLHDFMLVHDDIIDKSDTRRGRPSMHKILSRNLSGHKNAKFTGEDLAIVTGDVMYALGIQAFLSIKEDPKRKEKALRRFIDAAIYTGTGEFIELLYGLKDLDKIQKQDIYKIYDFKTAHYSFATPLVTGATLAGAGQRQIKNLFDYGICLGRAFQIKDDIVGMFSEEKEIGKSVLSDLTEAKKTLLIWYAYNNAGEKDKQAIRKIFSKARVRRADLLSIRQIITRSGALLQAKKEISKLMLTAQDLSSTSGMRRKYREFLSAYPRKILKL